MVGANNSTELWRPPIAAEVFNLTKHKFKNQRYPILIPNRLILMSWIKPD